MQKIILFLFDSNIEIPNEMSSNVSWTLVSTISTGHTQSTF